MVNEEVGEVVLREYQKEALDFLARNRYKGYIVLPPGTGKTLIACYAIKECRPAKALILCPKSVINDWIRELRRVGILERYYIVMNYEKFLATYGDAKKLPYIDFLVLDEAHRIKNIKAKTTRLVMKYRFFNMPKILLSATPFKDLIDLYTQFTILDPYLFGSWREFVEKYFIKEENSFGGVTYIPKDGTEREIFKKIAPYVFRKSREELALTGIKKIKIKKVFKTPEEYSWERFKKEVYKQVVEEIMSDFQSLDELDENEILEKLIEELRGKFITMYRLSQINNTEKHEFIKEFVENNPDTVVYTRFVEEAKILARITKAYLITGETTESERKRILVRQDRPLVMTSALSEGANLNGYGNLIFSTIPSTPKELIQIAGRIDRLTQERKALTYVFLLDEYNLKMLKLLKERKQLNDMLADELRQIKRQAKEVSIRSGF